LRFTPDSNNLAGSNRLRTSHNHLGTRKEESRMPRIPFRAALIGVLMLLPQAASGQELTICDPESALRRRTHVTLLSADVDRPASDAQGAVANFHVGISIERGGLAFAVGAMQIQDGASNTLLVAEKHIRPALTCADTDHDAIAGLTFLQFTMRNVKTGAPVVVTVLPADGEIDESGVELVTLVIVEGTAIRTLQTRQVTLIQDI
jgi:hypothetical protein